MERDAIIAGEAVAARGWGPCGTTSPRPFATGCSIAAVAAAG